MALALALAFASVAAARGAVERVAVELVMAAAEQVLA